MTTIKRLLIANRGEICVRIVRTARDLGIHTIAVHTAHERNAFHRHCADESHEIGQGQRPVDAYLDIDGLVSVARKAGADAVHPGYGFLSENPLFAAACEQAGILFVGPSVHTLKLLGDKAAARTLAES